FTLCFFLQAEDGIRDFHVTGVQTCALPILEHHAALVFAQDAERRQNQRHQQHQQHAEAEGITHHGLTSRCGLTRSLRPSRASTCTRCPTCSGSRLSTCQRSPCRLIQPWWGLWPRASTCVTLPTSPASPAT